MSAVQQRVLLLRHCPEQEGGSDCIFRREWAYSLNEQRQACVCYDYCDRAIFMLREREGGLFFLGQALCKLSLEPAGGLSVTGPILRPSSAHIMQKRLGRGLMGVFSG